MYFVQIEHQLTSENQIRRLLILYTLQSCVLFYCWNKSIFTTCTYEVLLRCKYLKFNLQGQWIKAYHDCITTIIFQVENDNGGNKAKEEPGDEEELRKEEEEVVNFYHKQHLNVLIGAAILLEQQTYSFDFEKNSLLYIAYKLTTKKKNVVRKGFIYK